MTLNKLRYGLIRGSEHFKLEVLFLASFNGWGHVANYDKRYGTTIWHWRVYKSS